MRNCDKCGAALIRREGPRGPFAACPNSSRRDPHPTYSLEEAELDRRSALPTKAIDADSVLTPFGEVCDGVYIDVPARKRL